MLSSMSFYQDIVPLLLQLEGPYRWYVLGGVLVILTAVMTRVIFKTFKWFLLIAVAAALVLVAVYYVSPQIEDWLLRRAEERTGLIERAIEVVEHGPQ